MKEPDNPKKKVILFKREWNQRSQELARDQRSWKNQR